MWYSNLFRGWTLDNDWLARICAILGSVDIVVCSLFIDELLIVLIKFLSSIVRIGFIFFLYEIEIS